MQTLKHITVKIHLNDDNNDPLFAILSEFEDMRTKNIIETVTIGILVQKYGSCRVGDDWGRIDEILTTPGWFSLKRVSLIIEINNRNNNVALLKLSENFPRLSSSNSLSFIFEVITK